MAYPQDPLALYKPQVEAFKPWPCGRNVEPIVSGLDGLRAVQVTDAELAGTRATDNVEAGRTLVCGGATAARQGT
jgi:hypothetical protein